MKLLMGLLLLLVSGAASAEWTYAGESDEFIHYVDRTTIRRNGNFVKMWSLTDYKKAKVINGTSTLSQRTQEGFDCKGEKWRTLALTTFSGQMLSGTVNSTDSSDTEKWVPVPPDTFSEKMWKIACGK